MSKFSLEVKKQFSVSADIIYDAWLDPEAIKEFMKPADVVSVPEPKMDTTVGGEYLFNMHVGDNVLPHKGMYKALERPNKIEFTWNSMNTNNEDSLVTIFIKATGDNSCELTLIHELLPTEAAKNDHNGGWTNILNTLEKFKS
jgi:uncharacterized protein YndB with AHSA1/START domain